MCRSAVQKQCQPDKSAALLCSHLFQLDELQLRLEPHAAGIGDAPRRLFAAGNFPVTRLPAAPKPAAPVPPLGAIHPCATPAPQLHRASNRRRGGTRSPGATRHGGPPATAAAGSLLDNRIVARFCHLGSGALDLTEAPGTCARMEHASVACWSRGCCGGRDGQR